MLSIGQFAQIAQVTHRMLRHWDTAGLLVPAHVDGVSGYRSYDPSQLNHVHRIMALRQLGFGLREIAQFLAKPADQDQLTALLQARQAEVAADHELATARLADVRRRLDLIEKEHHMSEIEIVNKPLPALRLAAQRTVVSSQPEVALVIGGMFDAVAQALGGNEPGMPIAQYRALENGLEVTAGFEFDGESSKEFSIIELPASPQAVCGVHLGSMDTIHESWQAVHQEIFGRGATAHGPCREVYVRSQSADQHDWVTELQQPIGPA